MARRRQHVHRIDAYKRDVIGKPLQDHRPPT